MDDLIAFLAARLDEDEAAAKLAIWSTDPDAATWTAGCRSDAAWYVVDGYDEAVVYYVQTQAADDKAVARHIARHDPARVLREVEAKRAILAAFLVADQTRNPWDAPDYRTGGDDGATEALRDAVRALAAVYSDHPDYRQEWASAS